MLFLGDVAALYLALYLTLLVRYFEQPAAETWRNHIWPFSAVFAAWLLVLYIADLYNLRLATNNAAFFRLALKSTAIAGLLAAVFFYFNPAIGIAPRTNLIIFVFIFTAIFIVWRLFYNLFLSAYLPKEQIAVIGYNREAAELIGALKRSPHLGYAVTAVFAGPEAAGAAVRTEPDIGRLATVVKESGISTIVLAQDPREDPRLRSLLYACLPLKIRILALSAFYETITGRIPIAAISEMWFLENLSQGRRTGFDLMKRAYDTLCAILLLFTTLPAWPLIAILIKLESPGPAFYLSRRLGQNKKTFDLFKFRTMREEGNNRTLTRPGDPRVTRFGAFLRKTRIDEIPQVINIIKGDMSFVGPRPERPELAGELGKSIPFYQERLLVKPGLTGSDQISGEYHSPSPEDTLKKLQYDLFYVKNRSVYLDLSIILKTIATVMRRSGV